MSSSAAVVVEAGEGPYESGEESDYEDELPEATLQNLVDQESLEWIFVGGKGGVGKTTTSCSLAVMLAQRRGKVLIISTDPAHNLSDAFGQQFGAKETLVHGISNLYAMEVDPKTNLAEMDSSLTGLDLSGGASQTAKMISELSTSVPGIDEAIAFNELMNQVRKKDFDVIVFDTAPTGHTLRLLGFPDALEKATQMASKMKDKFGGMFSTATRLLKSTLAQRSADASETDLFGMSAAAAGVSSGSLESLLDGDSMSKKLKETSDSVRLIKEQFCDATRTTFVCVCIPEFLSLYETERLVQKLAKIGMDVHNIVINQVLYPESDSSCSRCLARVDMQQSYIEQFYDLYPDFNLIKIPQLSSEVRHVSRLRHFAHLLLHPYSELTQVERERFLNFERSDAEMKEADKVQPGTVESVGRPALADASHSASTALTDEDMLDLD